MGTTVKVSSGGGRWLSVLMLLAILVLGGLSYHWRGKYQEEKERSEAFSGNASAYLDSVKRYKVIIKVLNEKVELNAAQTKRIALEAEDWKRLYSKEYQTVQKLKLRPSEVQSVGTIQTVSSGSEQIPAVTNRECTELSSTLNTHWMDITFTRNNLVDRFEWSSRDCVMVVNTITRKRFLFIKYGKASETWDAVSFNPNTTITGLVYKRVIK